MVQGVVACRTMYIMEGPLSSRTSMELIQELIQGIRDSSELPPNGAKGEAYVGVISHLKVEANQ